MSRRIACIRVPAPPTGAEREAAERRAALAGALLAVVPRLTPVRGRPGAWWGDASGMERRGGDTATARALWEAARAAGEPEARVGVADSCVAAAAATRETGSPWRVVAPRGDGRYLRDLPLALLPVSDAVRAGLALLGVGSCGALAALPAAEVELRWGSEGLLAWRLATGTDRRWPFRPAPPGAVGAGADFDPPVEGGEALRFVVGGLVEAVCAALAERQRLPAALRLTLRTEGAGGTDEDAREVRPARPTADRRVLADLCRRALEARPAAGPVAGVALEAVEEGAERADQLDAFRPPAPDPGALHAALLPVLARWGEGALCRAERQGAHLPAEHAVWSPLGAGGIAAFAAAPSPPSLPVGVAALPRAELPLCLRRLPAPLPVRVHVSGDGAPLRVGAGAVPAAGFPPALWKTRAQGPERISAAWWARGSAREYWRVESGEGWLGLLFRDAASGSWFLEGWYD